MSGVAPEKQGWLVPTLIVVALISAFRIVLLAFSRADLNVDEVQYWLWGQELAFGYYSKPPMIGWVIGLVTEVAGSDAPFWVRVPAVLFHAATAVILGAIAARHFGDKPAVLTALCYIVLPMVSVGSLLISTDTIMFPFLALALAGYLRLLEDRTVSTALFTGAALGLAFMSKYAAIYYLFTAVLSAFFVKQARLDARSILLIGVAFLVTISPNIAWNILNGFLTLSHTMDNADWGRAPGGRASFNVAGMAEFFITQFAFFGPILFGALLLLVLYAWRGRLSPIQRILLIFSLPIVALLCGQALLSRANPNWAAAAYIAGTLITVPWLMGRHRLWLILTFAIGGSLTVALPLSTLSADTFSLNGKSLFLSTYVGRDEMSRSILSIAKTEGIKTIVAENRNILADLFYTGRDAEVDIFARARRGRASHHYTVRYPFSGRGADPVLYVTSRENVTECDARKVARLAPERGNYRNNHKSVFVVPANCWSKE